MKLPACIRENVPLAPLTTFRIGGPARWLARPDTLDELAETLFAAERLGTPVRVLGGGSNILVADEGVDAMILRFHGGGAFCGVDAEAEGLQWRVGAGAGLQSTIAQLLRCGVSGPERLAGIPGSVGGAAVMNAGGKNRGLGDWVTEAVVYEPGRGIAVLRPPELTFGYRKSSLRGRIVLSLVLQFADRDDPENLLAAMRRYRAEKAATQPVDALSAGCMFKNPPGMSAGALIDAAGCKGMRVGDALVSGLHANFLVNAGRATAREVALLAAAVRDRVFSHAGVILEPELVVWGEDAILSHLSAGG